MAFATYEDYKALYKDNGLDEAGFARLIWDAERAMDDATTGAGMVHKLRLYPPTDEYGAEAVRRCACALVVASASALAGVLSLLTSVAGLPELEADRE